MTISNNTESVQLIVEAKQNGMAVFFVRTGQKYHELNLWSRDEEEYYVLDHPIPETLSAWAKLNIVEQIIDDQKTFDISYKGYGLTPRMKKILDELTQEIRDVINKQTDAQIDLDPTLNSIGWVVTLQ
jgi:hypothetical protein